MTVGIFLALVVVSLVNTLTIPDQPKVTKADKCENCTPKDCSPISKCAECSVCFKTKELAKCGGMMNIYGRCGGGMQCHVRHPNSHENRIMMPGEKIGRCEKG